jgi:hypothetical protein
MASITVGSTPVPLSGLGARTCLIQNLGPGVVYMDSSDSVSPSEGFKIAVGAVYETQGSGGYAQIYLVSDGTSDVRVVSI